MKTFVKKLVLVNLLVMFTVSFLSVDTYANYVVGNNTNNNLTAKPLADAPTADKVYLSDMDCTTCSVGYGALIKDQIAENTPITLQIENEAMAFEKGLFAHATSTLIYDLSGLDYDYFISYVGVDSRKGGSGDGVKFYVYTSDNGTDWTLRTSPQPKALKGNDTAQYLEIEITGANYLKLYADQVDNNQYDHAVYADARLLKNSYFDSSFKKVAEYDEIIKNHHENGTPITQYEQTLLQRELVANAGYVELQEVIKESEATKYALEWLMNDTEHLREYIMGGAPNGSYKNSLRVLGQLLENYESDLSDPVHGDLYQKLIISLSLSHSRSVRFWLNDGVMKNGNIVVDNRLDSPNQSNAVDRYRIMKKMYLDGKYDNAIFDTLEIEEMRYITGTDMADGEMEWLWDISEERNSKDPYAFIAYTDTIDDIDVWREKYYSEENRQMWDDKYSLTAYGINYEKYIPHFWTIFEEEGICWHIANLGANLESVHGIPNTLVGQPGHSAYFIFSLNDEGNGVWRLYNDVSGWQQTNDAGYCGPRSYYEIRWMNGWGNGDYASEFAGSYILLGQAAINDFDNYKKAKELVLLANSYQDDYDKSEELYREALKVQKINFDAWLGLANIYTQDSTKTEADLYRLEVEIAEALTYYPLPMHDLLNLLGQHMSDSANQVKHSVLLTKTLEQAAAAGDAETIQKKQVNDVANYLLNNEDSEVATFSFDGENAGVISLGSRFEGNSVRWDFSFDGGVTWTQTGEHAVQLTDEQIAQITAENDIKVHIIGVDYSEANIYTIEIEKASLPSELYANDLENRFIGADSSLEWKQDDGTWVSFSDQEPDLTGDKTIVLRAHAHGIYASSDEVTYTFTQEANTDTQKYVPISHLSLHEVSSTHGGNEAAENALDGNLNTHWHTNYPITDREHYITIALDRTMYLSALQYVPRNNGGNGTAGKAEVYVSVDGNSWELAGSVDNWPINKDAKTITFDEAHQANYVKFVIKDNQFGSASMINLFEDITKLEAPVADITYDKTTLTNQSVTATLQNPDNKFTITNNDGKATYVFDKNGSFTFEYVDQNGVKGSATATVTWIDKTAPKVHIEYDIETLTNQSVTATLVFDEENITIENNSGSSTYTFDKNGTFTFICRDAAGNETKAVAEVTWIDKVPAITNIQYSTTDQTTGSVIATLTSNKEITILNNGGSNTYTFNENGEFEFQYVDKAGNSGSICAKVDWIQKENPDKPNPDNPNPDKPVKPGDDKPNPDKPNPDIQPVDQLFSEDKTISIQGDHLQSDMRLVSEYLTLQQATSIIDKDENKAFKASYAIEKLFDFYLLKNNERFDLNGTYILAIQLESDMMEKDLRVVYLEDDGTITFKNSWIENGKIYFKTDHNSMYAVVSVKQNDGLVSDNPLQNNQNQATLKPITNTADGVNTGDETNNVLLVMIMLCASYVCFYSYSRNRKVNQ